MGRVEKFSVRVVADALRSSAGMKAMAARKLMVDPSTISKYIKRHPSLQDVVHQCAESTLDLAESKLIQNIQDGKEPSIFFYLKCKGKSRGYQEKEQGISFDAFRRALEQLAIAVADNVKDEATLDRIEKRWEKLRF